MKKTVIKSLVCLTVLLTMVSMSWAFNVQQHVKVAPGGKGDTLIFPFYFAANGGWETKITVVNTSPTYSVVAKIVFKSYVYSEEILDFLLYLTPADVWTGTLKNDGTGTLIYSDDDSAMSSASVWANVTPINKKLPTAKCAAVTPFDSSDYGYFEVVEAWYGDLSRGGTNVAPYPQMQQGERKDRPVTKEFLRRTYQAWVDGGGQDNGDNCPGQGEGREALADPPTDHTINVLAGHIELQNSLQPGYTSALPAVAMADLDMRSALTTAATTGIQDLNSRNTLGEIEAALAKNNLAMDYVNNSATGVFSAHVITFPTKMSRFVEIAGTNFCKYKNGYAVAANPSAYWVDAAVDMADVNSFANLDYQCQPYGARVYDLSENSTEAGVFSGPQAGARLCNEMNLLTTSAYSNLFKEGWTNYTFNNGTLPRLNNPTLFHTKSGLDFNFYGTPAIGATIMFKNSGIAMLPPVYTDGYVFAVADVAAVVVPPAILPPAGNPYLPYDRWYDAGCVQCWVPDYQYYNETSALGINSF